MERHRYLDVLRGVAILGILPVNICFFAQAGALYEEPRAMAAGSMAESVAWHLVRVFFEYKFVTIFSLLFGVGMVILRDRSEAANRPHGRLMLSRLLSLWAFGVLHATLLWNGDILAYYAPVGLLLFRAARWPARRLVLAGSALVLFPALGMGFLAASPDLAEAFAADEDGQAGTLFDPSTETQTYRDGTFLEVTRLRVLGWMSGFAEWGFYFVWRIAGLFLVGMGLARVEWFLRPAENRLRFVQLTVAGLALGIPLEALSSVVFESKGESASLEIAAELVQYVASLFLSAGYAGAVGLAVSRGFPTLLAPFEAIGKTAFTHYLFQSALCTTLFYSYGLALFGSLTRVALWGVVAGVWAAQIVLAPLWLRFATIGPMEWLWRSVTYGRRMPFRRRF